MTPQAEAQPADLPIPAATTDRFPAGIRVARQPGGMVFVNRRGQTLYGLDMRTVMRSGPNAAQYCQAACLAQWEPVLAPSGATVDIEYPQGLSFNPDPRPGFHRPQQAPDWTVIMGPQGPQHVYKGWHMLFVRKGSKPGEPAPDGLDQKVWNTLKYVPPVPAIVAPPGVRPVFHGGRYVLVDREGRLLFEGGCMKDCAAWQPFAGGAASAGIGAWSIGHGGEVAQWHRRGKPVFVASADDPMRVPAGAWVLMP